MLRLGGLGWLFGGDLCKLAQEGKSDGVSAKL